VRSRQRQLKKAINSAEIASKVTTAEKQELKTNEDTLRHLKKELFKVRYLLPLHRGFSLKFHPCLLT
jgi:exonuclease VII large subunit